MALFCCICESMGKSVPNFSKDKNTGLGYCGSHQTKRTDKKFQSIQQRATEKHKEELKNNPQKIKADPEGVIENDWEVIETNKGAGELWDWFEYQRTLMTGFCHHCNRPSCKNDDNRFYFSLHHILDKAHFPSVSTNKSNVLELCFWGEGSCHTRADNKILELSAMACWDEIVTKFCDMYPSIARSERRRIPEILMQYIDIER